MNDKLSIRISIDERVFPLKVNRNEEEKIRKAAKTINDRLLLYKQKYATNSKKDSFDFLAMVALDFATKYLDSENKVSDTALVHEVKVLTSELEDYIQNI